MSRSDYSFLERAGLEPVDNADTSFTYNLGFRQRTERNTINIDVARDTSPNSGSFVSVRDEFLVYVGRAMSERLFAGIALRASHTRTLGDVVEDDERDYVRLELEIEWALAERLFLFGGYNFTAQEFQSQPATDANSNSIYLGVAYRGRSRE